VITDVRFRRRAEALVAGTKGWWWLELLPLLVALVITAVLPLHGGSFWGLLGAALVQQQQTRGYQCDAKGFRHRAEALVVAEAKGGGGGGG
jgi:hypothetical protein